MWTPRARRWREAKRKQAYRDAFQILHDEVPGIGLFQDVAIYGASPHLRGAVIRHVLRNAAIPIITITALEIGNLLAGAVIVETVFAWPGIGQLVMQSVQARDFLVVQAIVLFVSLTYIALNLLADPAYTVVDPRIRGAT